MGAGAGATVGKLFGGARAMKGGVGTASITVGGVTVGALIACNALGDVLDPNTGDFDGMSIKVDYDQDLETALFVLIHLFGHTVN